MSYEETRARRKRLGLCIDCGSAPEKDSPLCWQCRDRRTVYSASWAAKRRPPRDADTGTEPAEKAGPRPLCRCGLSLPCNSCLPNIYEVAASRRDT